MYTHISRFATPPRPPPSGRRHRPLATDSLSSLPAFRAFQEKFTPTVYMHTQIDINCKMRAILIDWIVEVHLKFKLADPTLYLTCHIIDRFCMQENVHRSKLQLVGVTALLIACKYEEIFPTEVRDCVYITDHAYTREEVLEMEQTILRRLKFEITVPTPWTFLVRFLKVAKATDRQHHRAQYYLERCLQEHDGLSFRPSMLAAASVFLARIPDSGLEDAWVRALREFGGVGGGLIVMHGRSRMTIRRGVLIGCLPWPFDQWPCIGFGTKHRSYYW